MEVTSMEMISVLADVSFNADSNTIYPESFNKDIQYSSFPINNIYVVPPKIL